MSQNAYTLEFSPTTAATETRRNPATTLICAVSYALAVSVSDSWPALLLASILPAVILAKRFPLHALAKLNLLNAVMILTLALTWPEFSGGLVMGTVIALRVNMICVVFMSMVYPLGTGGIYEALCVLGMPEKMRVLIILTLRGIYTMHERFETALISVRLRAPNLKGMMKLRVFASVTASVLVQSALRSENVMRAVKCRGGFGGFSQYRHEGFNSRDVLFMAGFMVYASCVALLNYA
ncbi:MAG: hypothetical protein IJQ58_03900 [Synergistaceae bacterium]|nr:hypothetical protein [Synergistaceae bacterium]